MVQMTWMFYHSKDKWSQPRIKAFLNSVPDDKLILLDYYCDSVRFGERHSNIMESHTFGVTWAILVEIRCWQVTWMMLVLS